MNDRLAALNVKVCCALACLSLGVPTVLLGLSLIASNRGGGQFGRVAEIIIEGNHTTPDSKIREAVGLYPGQRLDWLEVEKSEFRLWLRFHSRFAWWRGDGPSITVEQPFEDGCPFRDIRIQFHELE